MLALAMIFLPIAERELRVAARKPATYWSRLSAGILAFVIAGSMIAFQQLSEGLAMGVNFGQTIFQVLAWLTFAGCCLAGVFLTADSISEEKREGTLGLLFLTDLRGYDVVFGKLLSTSLQAFYGLLAVFPLLALPLLMGGVTGEQFYRTLLALLNTLFFSLAAGVFISSTQRDSQQTMKLTLLFTAACLGLPLLLDAWIASRRGVPFAPVCGVISPVLAFAEAGSAIKSGYWKSLGVSHGIAWLFFIFASWITPKVWHEKAAPKTVSRAQRWKFGSAKYRAKLRAKWMETNPACWLSLRERWQNLSFQLIFAAIVGMLAMSSLTAIGYTGSTFLYFLIQIWITTQASRFFVEARRSGALELLLCTPLNDKDIVRGQARALLNMFLLPAMLTLTLQLLFLVIRYAEMRTSAAGAPGNIFPDNTYLTTQAFTNIVEFLTGSLALAWFGMWTGLTTNKASTAALKTYAFVIILPAIGISIVQGFFFLLLGYLSSKGGGSWFQGEYWFVFTTLFSLMLTVAKDVAFIVWARRRLNSDFRMIAAGETVKKSYRFRKGKNAAPTNEPPVTA